MMLSTFIFPSIYIYAELANYYESIYTIELIFIGFLIDYFITPKKKISK